MKIQMVVGFAILFSMTGAMAESYEFRYTVTGLSAPAPEHSSKEVWEKFAGDNNLDFDSTWNSLDWRGQVLDGLPEIGYPNGNPSGAILVSGLNIEYLGAAFSTLESIGGDFYIISSPSLRSLEGLEKLNTVNGNANFQGVPGLESLKGLDNVTKINGTLFARNLNITSLQGLESLERVAGGIFLSGSKLTSLTGLDSLQYVGGTFSADRNELSHLDELLGVDVEGSLGFSDNKISNINGLSSLVNVSTLNLSFNPITDFAPLSQLISVSGTLSLSGTNVTNVNGLANLESIGSTFYMGNMAYLHDLSGLNNLKSVGGKIYIAKSVTEKSNYIRPAANSWLCSAEASTIVSATTLTHSGKESTLTAAQSDICQ
jgi:hypothetical protein